MATKPSFAATPLVGGVAIATANTNRDGTGTLGTVVTLPANGGRIERLKVKAVGTTTAGMIRFFLWNGAALRLLAELTVNAITPSATEPTFEGEIELRDLVLPATWEIRASTHNAESFNVWAFGGSF